MSEHLSSLSFQEAFGLILRTYRKQLGLVQLDLEGDAKLDRSHVSRIERGEREPKLSTIIHLERVLQLPPGELIRRVRELLES
ncbi:MAG: helix-turn-helix transcriptional regulator [Chlorobi bacterium]|nr:helix-turn-helix transcriptional regulator [Chlorobiota bacterium]